MSRITVLFLMFFVVVALSSQNLKKYPFSRQDSAIIQDNLDRFEREYAQGDWKELSRYLNENGLLHWEHNYLEEALNYYVKSRVLNGKVNNSSGIAMINNNLGMIYADLRRYQEALDHFQLTLAARKYQKAKLGIVSASINIGLMYNHLDQYNESIKQVEEGLIAAKELNDPEQIRLCYGLLAETYEKMGDSQNSFKFFNLYKTFNDMISDTKVQKSQKETETARLQIKIIELEKRNKELEVEAQRVTIVEQQNEIQTKDKVIDEKEHVIVVKEEEKASLLQEMSKQELEMEVLEYRNNMAKMETQKQADKIRRQQLQALFLIVIVVLAILLIFIVWRNWQKQKDHSFMLEDKNTKISQQKTQIQRQANTLHEKNEELVKLTRFKDGMTGMLVHDLKNPLNAIFHHNEKVKDAPTKRTIKNAGRQMMNMILNILDVQKYEDSKLMPLNKTVFKIKDNIELSFENVSFLASQKNIELKYETDANYEVKGDEEVIQRVVTNLLTNAIKYSEQNSTVRVVVESVNLKVQISIIDTGVGIPKDKQDQVFEMFGQVKPRKSGSLKSSGVGLTFCKLAIKSHGGNIDLKSEEGKGSAFWFYLTKAGEAAPLIVEPKVKSDEKVEYSKTELAYLKPFAEDLKATKVYQLSKVRGVLKKVEHRTENIKNWQIEMLEIVMSVNGERYEQKVNEMLKLSHENL